jgi:hypothetical protein
VCSNSDDATWVRLDAALDALAGEDLHHAGSRELLERTARLVAVANRVAAELTRTVRRADLASAAEHDGLGSMAAWLRGHARMSPAAAARVVRAGGALEHLPTVGAAAARGLVSAEQVAVVAAAVGPEELGRAAEEGVDLAGVDAVLAEVAATAPYRQLTGVVHHYLARLDPDGPEPDPTEQRSLTLARHPDGSVSIRGELDAVGGERLQAAVESIAQADRPAGDTRSRAQRQADALVQLCDNQLASGVLPRLRTVKPHVVVTLGVEDLVDPTTGPAVADTGFGAVLSAARARWIACDATVTRIVLGPDGQPLDVGRSHRVVPPHLRKAVEARDRGCVFAGCQAPSSWCDVQHLVEWALGGETSLENSGLLCERHHTKVHHGFRIARDPGGRWRTWRPDGTEILVLPPLLAPADVVRPRAEDGSVGRADGAVGRWRDGLAASVEGWPMPTCTSTSTPSARSPG